MRRPRLKPTAETFYHACNRVSGIPGYLPFQDEEKEKFLSLLHRLGAYYVIDVVSFQIMSNHFHLVLRAPAEPPSVEETCKRYRAYYHDKRPLHPGSKECVRIAAKLRDVSCFMHDLEHQFTTWFNASRPVRRRGTLWAGRFKSVVLEVGQALWSCWKYVEMNPVRAFMVDTPSDYAFGTFGCWKRQGRHPFEPSVEEHVLPHLQRLLGLDSLNAVRQKMEQEFKYLELIRGTAMPHEESALPPDETRAPLPFSIRSDRRVRHWIDGLAIGSTRFVRRILSRAYGPGYAAWFKPTPAEEEVEGVRLVCGKPLVARRE
jgi:putative transposase